MAKGKLDTSWFDLKNYDNLKNLDLHGWIEQIAIRSVFLDDMEIRKITLKDMEAINGKLQNEKDNDDLDSDMDDLLAILDGLELESISQRIKNHPAITKRPAFKDYIDRRFPFNTASVYATSVTDHLDMANDSALSDIAEFLEHDHPLNDVTYDRSNLLKPVDMIFRERSISRYHNTQTHITVDLAASNDKIMHDFNSTLLNKTIA